MAIDIEERRGLKNLGQIATSLLHIAMEKYTNINRKVGTCKSLNQLANESNCVFYVKLTL